jgi:hypothetical protein
VQLGPRQVVAMLSLEFSDLMLAPQIEEAVISLEKRVREENPEIVALFVKPQTAKTFQDTLDVRVIKHRPIKRCPYCPTRRIASVDHLPDTSPTSLTRRGALRCCVSIRGK